MPVERSAQATCRPVPEKFPALAHLLRDIAGMKASRAVNFLFLTVAIGWCGFSVAELLYSKLPVGEDEVEGAAVVALASASKTRETLPPIASGPAPSPAIMTIEPAPAAELLPDPVALGPLEIPGAPAEAPIANPAANPDGKPGNDQTSAQPADDSAVAQQPVTPAQYEDADLLAAVKQGTIEATLRGNGRERLTAQLRNNSPTPLRVSVATGQVLESGRNRVIVTRGATAELMPARTVELRLPTAALLSSNTLGFSAYKFSYQSPERVELFLKWLKEDGSLNAAAVQVAVLALTENLPLRALAKFAQGAPGESGTDAFRAETGDLLAALTALREFWGKTDTLALANDPQLRIEAMIEPLSREAAKRYYGITENMEWEFWKRELLEGSPSTRHYALYGIARFYPDVALGMLPKWARESGTHPVYRMAAVQALADTQRPEALPILRELATELGTTTDLGKAAAQSAKYLDRRLTELASRTHVVSFRDQSRVDGL